MGANGATFIRNKSMVFGKLTQKHPIDEELKQLLEFTDDFKPGDKITPDQIEEVTSLRRNVYPWQVMISKWREQSRVRGQFFKWIQTESAYGVLTADQTVLECNRRQKVQRRDSKRVAVIASAVDEEQLSEEAKALREAIVASATTIAANYDAAMKKRAPLLKALEPLPRIAQTG